MQSDYSYILFVPLTGESVEHINRLPPSRSEDTLILPKKSSTPLHRKRATTVNTSFTSDNATPQPSTSSAVQYVKKMDSLATFDPNAIDELAAAAAASTMKTSTPNAPAANPLEKETGARKKDDATRYGVSLFADNPNQFKDLHIAENDATEPLAQPLPSTSNPFAQQIGIPEPPTLPPLLSPDHVKKPLPPKPVDSDSFIIGQLNTSQRN